jgi:putative nucleotidyltransferase with HDIG domain
LFVDDDDLILRAFSRDMRQAGPSITLARSGPEALEILSHRDFSVVVADFQMPGMDGITFLEQVSKKRPEAVRILTSGRADFNMAIEVINRVGLFNFVPKPWEPYSFRDIIRRAVEHHAISLENKRLSALLGAKCDELSHLAKILEHEIQNRTTNLLLGLVNALDLRDTETQWHSRRVAVYSRRLAEQLNIQGDALLAVERGALLHDVGKIGVSDTILLKPGKLTPEEWVEMKKHSDYGYQILEKISFLGDARLLVLQHHERWDGAGYPKGLKAEEIYVGARIFAVIDTYDAMTSDRPYRKALPHETACKEICDMSGKQFDPSVVESWNEIPTSEIIAIREAAASTNKTFS